MVLVATIRALKLHGGQPEKDLFAGVEDVEAVERGLDNLRRHCENMEAYGVPVVVAINQFPTDTAAEVNFLLDAMRGEGRRIALSNHWGEGGAGALALAEATLAALGDGQISLMTIY